MEIKHQELNKKLSKKELAMELIREQKENRLEMIHEINREYISNRKKFLALPLNEKANTLGFARLCVKSYGLKQGKMTTDQEGNYRCSEAIF